MSIPQGVRTNSWTVVDSSHDGLPHVVRSIDSWVFTMRFDSADELSHILAVGVVVGAPAAPRGRIGLNVQPNHSV